MKLPFEFGVKLIFRLVFPGAILAAALTPGVRWIFDMSRISIKFEYLFPLETIAFGWAVVVSDMHIYMLFEGRRYWPRAIRKLLVRCQNRRLKWLDKVTRTRPPIDGPDKKASVEYRRYLEDSVEYGNYPVGEEGEAYVAYPTQLGNLIEAYENYPNEKYGLDAVFYWNRLWVVLDKDLREEIDNAQAIVDSTVYIAFGFYLSALVTFFYASIGIFAQSNLQYLSWFPDFLYTAPRLPYVPGPVPLLGLSALCFFIGFAIYCLSLPAHRQFGELFKSVFDQHRLKLNFEDVFKEVEDITGDPTLRWKPQREKNQIVWQYLRWGTIQGAKGKNFTVKQWGERRKTQAPPEGLISNTQKKDRGP